MKKILSVIFGVFLVSFQNCFAWDNLYSYNPFKKNNQNTQNFYDNGTMTGYSVPVNNGIFEKLNIKPQKSPAMTTDLFSVPAGNQGYNQSNSIKKKDNGGLGSSTGVTIIYD